VLDALAPGVVQTATPRRPAAARSIESVPTPTRAITRSAAAASSTAASNRSVETIAPATPSSNSIISPADRAACRGANRNA
jgi:hypothetical protein